MSTEVLAELGLVDHHCHGVVQHELTRQQFAALATESGFAPPVGGDHLMSQVGTAITRWCPPLLGLDVHTDIDTYLARRAELGPTVVNQRLLTAAGSGRLLIETGYRGDEIATTGAMAELAGCPVSEVVRIETVAEQMVRDGAGPHEIAQDFAQALAVRTVDAVGLKSVVAYRYGLDFDPARPTLAEVRAAAERWLGGTPSERNRVSDPVLLRHLLWSAVDVAGPRQLPLQFHVGYGDSDLDLFRVDPTRMSGWLRAVQPSGMPVMLLHCYPFQREAAYLAAVFPHVYCDVGLAVPYSGPRSTEILAEMLEIAPFHKVLYSSDAFGLAELYVLGAALFRRGLSRLLDSWVADGDWSPNRAAVVANLVGRDNALRVYQLDPITSTR